MEQVDRPRRVECPGGGYGGISRRDSDDDAAVLRHQSVRASTDFAPARSGIPIRGVAAFEVLPAMLGGDAGALATWLASGLVVPVRRTSMSTR